MPPHERLEALPAYQHNPVVLRLARYFMERISSHGQEEVTPTPPIRVQAKTEPQRPPAQHERHRQDQGKSTTEPLALPSEPSEEEQQLAAELRRIQEQARRERRRNGR